MTDTPSATQAPSTSEPVAGTEVLIPASRIASRVRELGAEITHDYRDRPMRLIGVLKGAFVFLADLIRAIDHPDLTLDFLGVATYGTASQTSGEVRVTKDLDHSIEGLDVVVVEDILDTGVTFHYLMTALRNRRPGSLHSVVLLDKPSRRIRPAQADYVGFTIPDAFVIGYGLDFGQRFRQLSYIGILKT
jgi:hypoxanthine phosphoribosyltransferase